MNKILLKALLQFVLFLKGPLDSQSGVVFEGEAGHGIEKKRRS